MPIDRSRWALQFRFWVHVDQSSRWASGSGWSIDSSRHLSASRRFQGDLQPNAWPGRIGLKRLSIEEFQSYRLICRSIARDLNNNKLRPFDWSPVDTFRVKDWKANISTREMSFGSVWEIFLFFRVEEQNKKRRTGDRAYTRYLHTGQFGATSSAGVCVCRAPNDGNRAQPWPHQSNKSPIIVGEICTAIIRSKKYSLACRCRLVCWRRFCPCVHQRKGEINFSFPRRRSVNHPLASSCAPNRPALRCN